jgi:hypothetical protein
MMGSCCTTARLPEYPSMCNTWTIFNTLDLPLYFCTVRSIAPCCSGWDLLGSADCSGPRQKPGGPRLTASQFCEHEPKYCEISVLHVTHERAWPCGQAHRQFPHFLQSLHDTPFPYTPYIFFVQHSPCVSQEFAAGSRLAAAAWVRYLVFSWGFIIEAELANVPCLAGSPACQVATPLTPLTAPIHCRGPPGPALARSFVP